MLRAKADGAPLPPAEGVRLIDLALIAYGRAFEHPCKLRIVRWLIRRLAAGRVEVKHAGNVVVAIAPEDYMGWAIFKTGYYEPASLALALRIMTAEPGWFIDIGANFGWYTCAVASIPDTRVVCVEPDSGNCSSLRANIARNGLRNVVVFNGAVGPEPALLPMSLRSPGNSGTVAVDLGETQGGSYWVAATSLNALFDRLIRSAVRPVLMKIDVEGFEAQVLAGLDFDGPFRPKNILIEFEPTLSVGGWRSRADFAAFFAAREYELFDVLGHPLADDSDIAEQNVWARDRSQQGHRP